MAFPTSYFTLAMVQALATSLSRPAIVPCPFGPWSSFAPVYSSPVQDWALSAVSEQYWVASEQVDNRTGTSVDTSLYR